MVGGDALVGAAVAHLDLAEEQLAVFGGLRARGKTGPVRPTPLELDGVRAVGQALHAEGVARPQPHHVGHAGGVWRRWVEVEESTGVNTHPISSKEIQKWKRLRLLLVCSDAKANPKSPRRRNSGSNR